MAIYDVIKDAVSIAQQADNIDLYKMLIDIQKECLDLISENKALKDENKRLEETASMNDSLIFENNNYYLNNDTGSDGPYCSTCWDSNKKLIRMHDISDRGHEDTFMCNVCKIITYI